MADINKAQKSAEEAEKKVRGVIDALGEDPNVTARKTAEKQARAERSRKNKETKKIEEERRKQELEQLRLKITQLEAEINYQNYLYGFSDTTNDDVIEELLSELYFLKEEYERSKTILDNTLIENENLKIRDEHLMDQNSEFHKKLQRRNIVIGVLVALLLLALGFWIWKHYSFFSTKSSPLILTTINPTPMSTPIPTSVPTPDPTAKPTSKPTPVPTPMPTAKPTPTLKPTPTPTPSPSPTLEPEYFFVMVSTPTPKPTARPTPTPIPTPKPTPVPTPKPTASPTPTPTLKPTPTPIPTPTVTPKPTLRVTPTPTPRPRIPTGKGNFSLPFQVGDTVVGWKIVFSNGKTFEGGYGYYIRNSPLNGEVTDGAINPWESEITYQRVISRKEVLQ